jgi:hypothetical protein
MVDDPHSRRAADEQREFFSHGSCRSAGGIRVAGIRLNRAGWERLKDRLVQRARQGRPNGPFLNWDDPNWDQPRNFLDAIWIWCPAFAQLLDQLRGLPPGEILAARTGSARDIGCYTITPPVRNSASGPANRPRGQVRSNDRNSPSLRVEFAVLFERWHRWDDTDRLIHAPIWAARLGEILAQQSGLSQTPADPESPGELAARLARLLTNR